MNRHSLNWEHLGDQVRRRRQVLGIKQNEIPGVGTATMSHIENAKQDAYKDFVLAALERGLKWKPGSVDSVLAGGEPAELDEPAPAGDEISDVLELARAMRTGLEKSQDRDTKLSLIIELCEALTWNQALAARQTAENSMRLNALLEHFGLGAVPLSSVPE